MITSYKIKKNAKKKYWKIALLLATILLLGLVGFVIYKNQNNNTIDSTPIRGNDSVTEESDKLSNQDTGTSPKSVNEKTQTNETTTNTLKSVDVVITFAGLRNDNVEVRSYIPGIYESTGKCTAIFKSGNTEITRTVDGIKDATYTRCDRVQVDKGEFANSSAWTVIVKYSSLNAKGESESKAVTGI